MAEANITQSTQGQNLPLQDRVAIVTGSSRGIGRAIALHLASLGAKLVINYCSNSTQANDVVSQINSTSNSNSNSPRAIAVKANVSDPDQVKSLFDAAESTFLSPVNILVNSAGVLDGKYPAILNTTLEDFDRTFDVNARGAFVCCKEGANRIKRGGGGRIICLSTSLAAAFRPGYGAYTASKAAVEAMVKIMAKELKGTGITANCVAPGPIATDMFYEGKTEEMINKTINECPHGRLGQTEDVAPVVGFLAGDASEWVNGQIIRLFLCFSMGNLLCCVQVDQSTVAIKEQFGKYQDVLEPGCHCLPWFLGFQLAGYLSLRLQQLDVRCETKTKDNVFVNVVASIQYRALADKANDAFYKLSNTKGQIQAYVFDVIRASVPKLNLDDVFEQKNEIARAVEDELEKAMSAYGYEIVQTLIVDIEPDEHVKRAMNEINAAARMRVAANEKAEAEKILQIKRAEGEAESKYLSGLGIARQRQAIVDGLRDSVLGFSVNVPGTSAKDVMDMVLLTQYFDTMKEIGASSKSSAVFLPHGPGAVRDVASQIRDGLLQASVDH
ncbi:hypothetical protein K7X08_031700 [Anisodus acutangulus]|uniref:Band 7 domain-containing protein n=2 Tax=Anisodus TaxID=243963 RepID=A0A9Q1MLU9_9SOLA|nr:hypothetical protein K7X08_031700 [Anisodus acutangulus]